MSANPPFVDRIVIVVTEAGPHLQLLSNNGEVLLTSEIYSDISWADTAAQQLSEQLGDVPVVRPEK